MRKIYSEYVKKQNSLQAALRVGQPLQEDHEQITHCSTWTSLPLTYKRETNMYSSLISCTLRVRDEIKNRGLPLSPCQLRGKYKSITYLRQSSCVTAYLNFYLWINISFLPVLILTTSISS